MATYWELNKQYIDGQWIDNSEDDQPEVVNLFDRSVVTTFKSAGTGMWIGRLQ